MKKFIRFNEEMYFLQKSQLNLHKNLYLMKNFNFLNKFFNQINFRIKQSLKKIFRIELIIQLKI